jgi:DNA-binding transcriptional ArsR family regulator
MAGCSTPTPTSQKRLRKTGRVGSVAPLSARSDTHSSAELLEPGLVKALGHPLRLRILELILDRGEDSPVRLARRIGQPLPTVSRHVRMLRDLGFVELTRTEPRRGAVEHFYRGVRLAFIDDGDWARLPIVLRRGLARQTFRKIFTESAAAGSDGGFDAADAHLDRMPLELDEVGRRELSQELHDVMRRADAIQLRSNARRSRVAGGAGRVESTILALLHFRST